MNVWYSNIGNIEITLSDEQIARASHQGDCTLDVREVAGELNLDLPVNRLRDALREYGAWDEEELSDHVANIERVIWLAAGDLQEG